MKKFLRKNAFAVIIMITGLLSLVFVHVFSGLRGHVGEEKYYIETLDFVFGGAKMQVTTKEITKAVTLNGGVSIFGVVWLVMFIASIFFEILSIFFKKFPFDYYGAVFMIISGIGMLMLFNMGTIISIGKNAIDFRSFVLLYSFELGTGAIVCGITAIVGGIIGIFIEENNLIR